MLVLSWGGGSPPHKVRMWGLFTGFGNNYASALSFRARGAYSQVSQSTTPAPDSFRALVGLMGRWGNLRHLSFRARVGLTEI